MTNSIHLVKLQEVQVSFIMSSSLIMFKSLLKKLKEVMVKAIHLKVNFRLSKNRLLNLTKKVMLIWLLKHKFNRNCSLVDFTILNLRYTRRVTDQILTEVLKVRQRRVLIFLFNLTF